MQGLMQKMVIKEDHIEKILLECHFYYYGKNVKNEDNSETKNSTYRTGERQR